MNILGYDLRMTCGACPEQYDVYKGDELVGYLRLRHGFFRADYPHCGGETIHTAYPNGDGCFNDEERDKHLTEAICAIHKKHTGEDISVQEASNGMIMILKSRFEEMEADQRKLRALVAAGVDSWEGYDQAMSYI